MTVTLANTCILTFLPNLGTSDTSPSSGVTETGVRLYEDQCTRCPERRGTDLSPIAPAAQGEEYPLPQALWRLQSASAAI